MAESAVRRSALDHPATDGSPALEELRSFTDPRRGIAERFLTPTIGGGRTVAVLSRPIAAPRDAGWVVCHGIAMDQINLQPFEVPVTRRVAASGFPVLRYHGQGYGDSEMSPEEVTVESAIAGAVEAVRLLREATGVRRVGLFGPRFGGAVAAIAAERTGADGLVLWDPVVSGRKYATRLGRLSSATELVTRGRAQLKGQNPIAVLEEKGVLDVQGIPVRRALFEGIAGLDLRRDVASFAGRSVVVQISTDDEPRPDLEKLVAHLNGIGGSSRLEIVVDGQAEKFGQPRLVGQGDGTKVDTMSELARSLVEGTAAWCEEVFS